MLDRVVHLEQVAAANHVLEPADPERGHHLPDLLGDQHEVVDDLLRRSAEPPSQLRILGGDADGAGVQVADAHHDAAHGDQGRCGEAELVRAQQRSDDHVATGSHAAVDLDRDPGAQVVEEQRLLCLGQPDLPGHTRALDRRLGGGTRTSVVAGDRNVVGVGLGHAGGDRSHPHFRHQLDRHRPGRIGAAQVVDQLLEVFDRVDVVVRRRADEADARRRVPRLRDPRVDLAARQLAALPRLRALRHLDLKVVGVREVVAGDTEAAARDLLDGRPSPRVVGVGDVARGILASLAGVGPRAEPVHGDRQRLVRLASERAETHRAGGEALDDLGGGLDLLQRHRLSGQAELYQPPKQRLPHGVFVCVTGILRIRLVGVAVDALHGVLEPRHRVRVPDVHLAVPPPLQNAADRQDVAVRSWVGAEVTLHGFGRELLQTHAADPRGGSREVLVD